MGRLIDADALIEEIESLSVHVNGLRNAKTIFAEYVKHYKESVLRVIDEQPIAYNPDKVVEELEDIKGYACMEMDCEKCKYTAMCFEGERSEHVAIDKAIKAVRKGGVE